jgi:uncharacterized protein (TIGR02597 family)
MKIRLLILFALVALTFKAEAEESASVPEGFVKIAIQPSPNGSAYALTQFFAPLHRVPLLTGRNAGAVSSVSANTLSDDSAGWTPNTLAVAGSPYFVNLVSGAGEGNMFQITANSGTQLTVNTQGQDLTALGIQPGDAYEILPGHTLLGIVGTPSSGVLGGTSAQLNASVIDKVLVNDSTGAARFYYYDTVASQWRTVGSAANQGNLIIAPKSGLVYYRIATTPLEYTFYGRAPHTGSRRLVASTGSTIVAPYYPQDITLGALGLHLMPGWRKLGDPGVTLNSTDRVNLKVPAGTIFSYYHDGSAWKRVGSAASQNNQILSAGSSVILTRFGTVGQQHAWTQSLPYNLD